MRLDRPEVAAWWQLAASDLRVARLLANADPAEWRQVCFHCQQAAEKALKSVLEAEVMPFGRTHDLVALLGACRSIALPLGNYLKSREAEILTRS